MTNNELTAIFADINDRVFSRKYRKINAEFYSFRQLKHTIQWSPFRIRIRVSDYIKSAPDPILECLAIILLSRIYKLPVDKNIRERYNDYADLIEETYLVNNFNRIDAYKAEGEHFDLNRLFDQLNIEYFNSRLQRPRLGWSRNKSYRRLGFYDRKRDLLVISRIFDNQKVSPEVVGYLLYHEMLHIKYPAEKKNGRRIIHSPAFRKEEKKYPGYNHINQWLKSHLNQL